jgi:hypothetical protein
VGACRPHPNGKETHSTAADRHLLIGFLALQTGPIDQAALTAAFHAWTQDKARPLADHLVALGQPDAAHRPLPEGLAAGHPSGAPHHNPTTNRGHVLSGGRVGHGTGRDLAGHMGIDAVV